MTNSSTMKSKCNFEPIPSYFDLISTLYQVFIDSWNSNYAINCSHHTFWLLKISLVDIVTIAMMTFFLVKLRFSIVSFLRPILMRRFDTFDNFTTRSAETVVQLTIRSMIIPMTIYEVFIRPECSVLMMPSRGWKDLDTNGNEKVELVWTTRFVYRFAMAIYCYHITSIMMLDEKRRDFWILMVHHFATITLITMAYTIKYTEMGLLILLLHDMCDPFMEVAKICHYMKFRRDREKNYWFKVLCEPFFLLFTLMWIPSRMYFYPLRGIYQLTLIPRTSCDLFQISVASILLSILFVLNSMWLFMIIRSLVHRLFLGEMTDETMETTEQHFSRKKVIDGGDSDLGSTSRSQMSTSNGEVPDRKDE